MLFHKKTRGAMKWIWGVLVVLIAASMILLYFPSLFS